jgi:hypothetical protein
LIGIENGGFAIARPNILTIYSRFHFQLHNYSQQ